MATRKMSHLSLVVAVSLVVALSLEHVLFVTVFINPTVQTNQSQSWNGA